MIFGKVLVSRTLQIALTRRRSVVRNHQRQRGNLASRVIVGNERELQREKHDARLAVVLIGPWLAAFARGPAPRALLRLPRPDRVAVGAEGSCLLLAASAGEGVRDRPELHVH